MVKVNKLCSKCQKYKDFSEFYSNKSTSDGCSHWCKLCNRDYERSPERKKDKAERAKAYFRTEAGRRARQRAYERYLERKHKGLV